MPSADTSLRAIFAASRSLVAVSRRVARQIAVGPWKRLCSLPDGPQFVTLKGSVPRPGLWLRLGHAAHDGGSEVIPAAGVPGHQLAQQGQHVIGHHRPVVTIDLVEQAADFRALDAVDLAAGVEVALEDPAPLLEAAQLFLFSSWPRYSSAIPFNM